MIEFFFSDISRWEEIFVFNTNSVSFHYRCQYVTFNEKLFHGFKEVFSNIEFIMSHALRHYELGGSTALAMK